MQSECKASLNHSQNDTTQRCHEWSEPHDRQGEPDLNICILDSIISSIYSSFFFPCFLYPNHLHLYVLGVGEEGEKGGRRKERKARRAEAGKKESKKVRKGQNYKGVREYLQLFFFFLL